MNERLFTAGGFVVTSSSSSSSSSSTVGSWLTFIGCFYESLHVGLGLIHFVFLLYQAKNDMFLRCQLLVSWRMMKMTFILL